MNVNATPLSIVHNLPDARFTACHDLDIVVVVLDLLDAIVGNQTCAVAQTLDKAVCHKNIRRI